MADQDQKDKVGKAGDHPPLPPDSMIVLPVRQTVLFPGIVLPLAIARQSSIAAAQEAVPHGTRHHPPKYRGARRRAF
jgi:ATP-dependent Lon protease